MSNYTQARYDARALAMERLQSEAEKLDAEGIVAIQLHEHSPSWGSHVIEFFAIGTTAPPGRGRRCCVVTVASRETDGRSSN